MSPVYFSFSRAIYIQQCVLLWGKGPEYSRFLLCWFFLPHYLELKYKLLSTASSVLWISTFLPGLSAPPCPHIHTTPHFLPLQTGPGFPSIVGFLHFPASALAVPSARLPSSTKTTQPDNSPIKTQCHCLGNTRLAPQMSLVASSFVLPLCRCLFSVYLTARQIMMTFVSLINPAFQNKTVDFFIAISTSSTQHCAQRIVGDQQIFSGGKEGEGEERRPLFGMPTGKKKKKSPPVCLPLDCGQRKECFARSQWPQNSCLKRTFAENQAVQASGKKASRHSIGCHVPSFSLDSCLGATALRNVLFALRQDRGSFAKALGPEQRAELPGLYLQNSITLKVENDVVAAQAVCHEFVFPLTLVSCTLLSDTSFSNWEGTKETHTGLTAEF